MPFDAGLRLARPGGQPPNRQCVRLATENGITHAVNTACSGADLPLPPYQLN